MISKLVFALTLAKVASGAYEWAGVLESPGNNYTWTAQKAESEVQPHDEGNARKLLDIPGAWEKVRNTAENALESIGDLGSKVVTSIKAHVDKSVFADSFDKLKGIGADLASKVDELAQEFGDSVGDFVEDVGILALGIGKKAVDFFHKLYTCAFPSEGCKRILPHCDCTNGASYIKSDGLQVTAKCSAPVRFMKRMSLTPEVSSSHNISGISVDCTRSLNLTIGADIMFTPSITISVDPVNKNVKLEINGTATAELTTILKAQGKCETTKQFRFPQEPLKHTFCYKAACAVFFLQGMAEAHLSGQMDGTISMGLEAEWDISAVVELAPNGDSDVAVFVGELRTKKALETTVSMEAQLSLSVGPHLTVVPIPGVPIEILPMITAVVKGHGMLSYSSDPITPPSLEQVEGCAALALNVFVATQITGYGFSPSALGTMTSSLIKKLLCEHAVDIADSLVPAGLTNIANKLSTCELVPEDVRDAATYVFDTVQAVKSEVCKAIETVIPDFDFSSTSDSYVIYDQRHVCATLAEISSAENCGSVTCKDDFLTDEEMEMTGIIENTTKRAQVIAECQGDHCAIDAALRLSSLSRALLTLIFIGIMLP